MVRVVIFFCAVSWATGFILDGFGDISNCDHHDHDAHHDSCPFYTHITEICGSDGVTYKDYCAFMKVKCASKHNQIHVAGLRACHNSHTTHNQQSAHVTSPEPSASTSMPQSKEPMTSTVMFKTTTKQAVTSTVLPVTSTSGASAENVLDFLCIELSREDCVPELSEVCGSDGFTYRNYCEFQKARCMHRQLKMEHSGYC
ncbi:serine protease inhibitor dipetalogastin-like [Haliotis rufescens]|uniref:serine protease inhibitor dipetalogastin-like n=1 Tax=Haliotis rufescens TaxID=6454 RepID=UPI001EB003D6|nr:serine protease inhibitor dipetalogastin-like [Haliotis rufescens]